METQGVLIHFVFQTKTRSFQDWSTILDGAYKSQARSPLPRGRGGGGCLSLSLLLSFLRKLSDFSHLRKTVGHSTTECFQILQKCLKWFSLCFRSLWLILAGPKRFLTPKRDHVKTQPCHHSCITLCSIFILLVAEPLADYTITIRIISGF